MRFKVGDLVRVIQAADQSLWGERKMTVYEEDISLVAMDQS